VCAHAVRVAMRKLAGVESAEVSLERATADIRLRPGNTVSLEQLRRIVKDNGFTSQEATVTAIGKIIERGGQPALQLTGANRVMLIVADPSAPAAFKQAQELQAAKSAALVQATGVVKSRPEQPDQLALRSIQPVR
jgi:copper chaperone CopZ